MVLSLRIAVDIYNKLKEIAYKEKRSINGQICYIIEKYINEINNSQNNI